MNATLLKSRHCIGGEWFDFGVTLDTSIPLAERICLLLGPQQTLASNLLCLPSWALSGARIFVNKCQFCDLVETIFHTDKRGRPVGERSMKSRARSSSQMPGFLRAWDCAGA